MGKFTSFVMNNETRQMTPGQSAAMAATDAAVKVGRTTVAPVTPEQGLGEQILQPAPTEPTQRHEPIQGQLVAPEPELGLPQADTGGIQGARLASPEEQQALYDKEIAEQRKPRGIVNVDEGTITLPISASVNAVSEMTNSMARMEHAADQDYGTITTGSVNRPDYRALEKLGMAEPMVAKSGAISTAKARPKQAFGGASYVGLLLSLSRLSSPEQEASFIGEGEKEVNYTKGATAIRKDVMTTETAKELEKLVAPTPDTVNPETGEATGVGYESQMDSLEQGALGDMIFRMATQSGLIHDDYNGEGPHAILKKKTGAKKGVETYVLTEHGAKMMQGPVATMLKKISPGTQRKVSLTPVRRGQFVGEAATEQKRITKVPDEAVSVVTPMMEEAMDVIGTTPYVVVSHNHDILSDMLAGLEQVQGTVPELRAAVQQRMAETGENFKTALKEIGEKDPRFHSPFNELFDVGVTEMLKAEDKSAAEATHTRVIHYRPDEALWYDQYNRPIGRQQQAELTELYATDLQENPEFEVAHEFKPEKRFDDGKKHADFAAANNNMAMEKLRNTLGDATNRKGQVFYYGSTVIGNSGRIMISNTELNWQSNKLARFMVGNPIATRVDRNGSNWDAFEYVAARAMLDGADLYTPKALVQRLRDVQADIDPLARQLYQTMQMPAGPERVQALGNAINAIKASPLVNGKEFEGTGEWGFIVDGFHEWGRMLDAKDNKRAVFHTRLRAEGDGINNGSSIQGLQFGDKSILERAGMVYDFDADDVLYDEDGKPIYKSVIPAGNMRDYTMGALFRPDAEGNRIDPAMVTENDINAEIAFEGINDNQMLSRLTELLPKIMKNGALRKKFIKIPLMTTIYGKPSSVHGDSASAFVRGKEGEILGIQPEEYGDLTRAFEKVIGNALNKALNEPLVHQSLLKQQAGWLFGIMDVVPAVKGPNGYVWQAGGDVWNPHPDVKLRSGKPTVRTDYYRENPETGERELAEGSFTARVANPSAGARKATTEQTANEVLEKREQLAKAKADGNKELADKLTKSIKSLESKIADWGEMTRNQLAVNGTHNIDSSVAQRALIEAKKEMGNKFWGGQVFDAFIGDVSSFEKLMDAGNKAFVDINRDYNIIAAEYEAMRNAFDIFEQRMNDLGPDAKIGISGDKFAPHRTLSSFIEKFGTAAAAKMRFKGGHAGFMAALNDAGIEVKQPKPSNTPKVVTKEISPQQMKQLVKWLRNNFLSPADVVVDDTGTLVPRGTDVQGLPIDSAMSRNVSRVQKAKDEFYATYRDRLAAGRQFN